jgi:hypothetical protein
MPIPNDVENLIRQFEKRNGDIAFGEINRKTVAAELRDRIAKPSEIDQGQSSLCGPAVFIYCLAKRKPMQYAQYVIDLYEKGEATIGRLKVKPGEDCKNFDPKPKRGERQLISEADWIALAGLRDSENNFLDYDHPNDQISGITLPGAISEWFAFADFLAVRKNTNIIFDESLYTLLQAHKKHVSGACVCLFVGANVLQGFPKGKSPADHWVVLNSPIKIDGKPVNKLVAQGKKVTQDKTLLDKKIQFSIFTWKSDNYPVNRNDPNLTVGKFLDYFYGYVAAQ